MATLEWQGLLEPKDDVHSLKQKNHHEDSACVPPMWAAIQQSPFWKERNLAAFSLLGSLGRYQDQMQTWQKMLDRCLEPSDQEAKYVKEQLKAFPRFAVDLPEDVVGPLQEKLQKAVANLWSSCRQGVCDGKLDTTVMGDMLAEASIAFQAPIFTCAQKELHELRLSATGEQKVASLVAALETLGQVMHEQGNPLPDVATVLERARQASGGEMSESQQREVQAVWDIPLLETKQAVDKREDFQEDANSQKLDVLAALSQWTKNHKESEKQVNHLKLIGLLPWSRPWRGG